MTYLMPIRILYHDIPMLKMVKNRIKIDTKDGHMSTFEIE